MVIARDRDLRSCSVRGRACSPVALRCFLMPATILRMLSRWGLRCSVCICRRNRPMNPGLSDITVVVCWRPSSMQLHLIGLSVFLFYESYERLKAPQAVNENIMIVTAGLGILLNVGIIVGLRRHESDLNIRAASVHMLGDALGSVAIIVGAVAIRYTGWLAIDPILSILIAALIVWSAVDIIRESLNILLEGLPRGINLQASSRRDA